MLGLPRVFGGPTAFSLSNGAEKRLLCIATGHRGRKAVSRGRINSRRHKTTEAGDEKSGHINAGPNEGILFLDSWHSSSAHSLASDA
jgi:hypothetical protein